MIALSRKSTRNIVLIVAVFLSVAFAGVRAMEGRSSSDAPRPSRRLVVKWKASVAGQAEAALPPSSMTLRRAAPGGLDAVFRRHGIREMRPLYPGLVRQKKARRLTDAQLTAETRRKFATRSRRAPDSRAPMPELSRTYVVELSSGQSPERALESLRKDPAVEFVEPEVEYHIQLVPDDPYFSSAGTWGQPYPDLYGVKKTSCPAAWDLTAGEGVVVAVVDTGVDYTHEDIDGNIWANAGEVPGNGLDDDGNGYVDDVRGWDFTGSDWTMSMEDNDPQDRHGHGTHVAGTVAAEGNNGAGVIGVAWRARIMPLKGFDDAGGTSNLTLARALRYAVDNGADVINNSWSGPEDSLVIQDAVDYAHGLGAVVVAAAGNQGEDSSLFFPAALGNVITVAASNDWDGKADFSNWGSKIDVAAPGVDILSLKSSVGRALGPVLEGKYMRISGTSMATPHVSGVAALVLSRRSGLTNEQVRQVLRRSSDDILSLGWDIYSAYGRINAWQALQIETVAEAKIQSPADGAPVSGTMSIRGIAKGPGPIRYALAYGAGETPSQWTTIQDRLVSVDRGELGVFDPSLLPDGRHTIRLNVYHDFLIYSDRIRVNVDYVSISAPTPPHVPDVATVLKPGAVVPVRGRALGPSFQRFRVEWARGLDPASGWASTGVTVTGGGAAPVDNAQLAAWDTTGIAEADFYTLRVQVDNAGFTSEARTLVYLEPDLLSPHWPQWLDQAPDFGASVLPSAGADGSVRLVLANPLRSRSTLPARLWSFSADGSSRSQLSLPRAGYFQPAVGDVDGLLGDETVVAVDDGLRIYRQDRTFSTLRVRTLPGIVQDMAFFPILLEDLDGDGRLEILGGGTHRATDTVYLYAWRSDGSLLSDRYPVALRGVNSTLRKNPLVVVDLDGDGRREILVVEEALSDHPALKAFNGDGSARAWSSPPLHGDFQSLVAGDLDRDGSAEILFCQFSRGPALDDLYVFGPDGSPRNGWPVALPAEMRGYSGSLALADFDLDGTDEVIVTAGRGAHVLRADGTPFSSQWPKIDPSSYATHSQPVIGDLDGDGRPDILFAQGGLTRFSDPLVSSLEEGGLRLSVEDGPEGPTIRQEIEGPQYARRMYSHDNHLLAYRADGTLIKSWRIMGANQNQSSVSEATAVIGDFDRNGKPDVALNYFLINGGGHSGRLVEGVLSVLTLDAPHDPAAAHWPVNYHDPRNTAARIVARPADVTGPVVTITAPAPAAVARVHDDVLIGATATDSSGVDRVVFEVRRDLAPFEAVFTATDTTEPYEALWRAGSLPNGAYRLEVRAYDRGGNAGTASPMPLLLENDVTAPVISAVASAAFLSSATVTWVTDEPADARVEYGLTAAYGQSTVLDPALGTAHGMALAGLAEAATYHYRVISRDARGNIGASGDLTFQTRDGTPPSVSITTPTAGAVLSGLVTVAANVSDNAGVVGVRFALDGVDLGPEDVAPPYAAAWNTASSATGAHVLTATARDAAGHRTVSIVAVVVDNFGTAWINFQPASARVPSGYLVDSGRAFGSRSGRSYGWDAANNNTRERDSSRSPDQRYDTLLLMQAGRAYTWEIAVPNGRYTVRLVAGDPSSFDGVYRINVEGTLAINHTPTSAQRWADQTVTVNVIDGRLTLSNAPGARNNKVCFIEVSGSRG